MNTYSRGFISLGIGLAIAIVVAAVLGGAGWWVSSKGSHSSQTGIFAQQNIQAYAECEEGCAGYWLRTLPEVLQQRGYSYEGSVVSFSGAPIPGADLETFVILTSGYEVLGHAKDASRVYFKGKIIPGADPETFEVLGAGTYARDKNAVYNTDSRNKAALIIEGADPASFQLPATSL